MPSSMPSYIFGQFGRLHRNNTLLQSAVRSLSTSLKDASPEQKFDKKILKVAIIGAPNAGKSTLINQIVKRRVFPVSKKIHTTRCRARAVYIEDDTQLVFLDTPGLVTSTESKKYKLEKEFMSGGEDAISEADLIGVVHDLSNGYTKAHLDPKVLRLLHLYKHKQSFLVMNKVDTVKSKRYLLDLADLLTGGNLDKPAANPGQLSEKLVAEVIRRKSYWEHFREIFMVSALFSEGTDDIRGYLLKSAYPGEWLFPKETFTDQTPVHLIEDTVRAALLDNLPQEIPYCLSVQLEYLDLHSDLDEASIVVLVGCKSSRVSRLVIGLKGERIKAISAQAGAVLSDAFQKDCDLKIVVSTILETADQKMSSR